LHAKPHARLHKASSAEHEKINAVLSEAKQAPELIKQLNNGNTHASNAQSAIAQHKSNPNHISKKCRPSTYTHTKQLMFCGLVE
jgi:hypothetical protein